MKKKCIYLLIINLFIVQNLFSQGIAVNLSGATADTSAILDIYSNTKGFLMPRMTVAERNAIVTPAEGLLIFNITSKCFEAFVNSGWYTVSCPYSCLPPSQPGAATHNEAQTQIIWNWNTDPNALGYKWNTVNDYATAVDIGSDTTKTETGLICNTAYTRYIWAYNSCGVSSVAIFSKTTLGCGVCYGMTTLTDTRDSKVYDIVVIGNQCWMAQNIDHGTYVNLATGQSAPGFQKYCWGDNTANCVTYGGLYEWYEIMGGDSTCNGTDSLNPQCPVPVQGICPDGWHVPSHYEYTVMEREVCTSGSCITDFPFNTTTIGWQGTDEGTKLKTGGSSGFNAQFGGYMDTGAWNQLGSMGIYWTSTHSGATTTWLRGYWTAEARSRRYPDHKPHGFSVRCVMD